MNAIDLVKEFGNQEPGRFKYVLDHVGSHYPSKKNMHLRDTRQVKGERKLRFLHITKVKNSQHLLGHISGPHELELEYEIELIGNKVRFSVLDYSGSEKDLRRIAKNLIKWLVKRSEMESQRDENEPRTNYKKDHYYLKRSFEGAELSNKKVQKGLQEKQFSIAFAKKLKKWGFIILNPQK